MKVTSLILYKNWLKYNVLVNGNKAFIYGYILGDIRYVEYSIALETFCNLNLNDFLLDVGCGHSILPLTLKTRTNIVAIDISRRALRWQITKSKKIANKDTFHVVLASADKLPFKANIFQGITSISVIEHLPYDLDLKACSEMGRVLNNNGICLITTSASKENKTIIKKDFTTGIPLLLAKTLKPFLPIIFKKFKIGDRSNQYFERFYSKEDILKLLKSSGMRPEKFTVIKRKPGIIGTLIQLARKIIIPYAFLTIIEFLCAKTFIVTENSTNAIAFVIKLKKKI